MAEIQAGDMPNAVGAFIRSWTGIYGLTGKEPVGVNLMRALNPLDMSDAPAWKATLWTSVMAKVVKKFTHVDPIDKIPVVNRFLKFS